jgi:hypothetical protein
MPRRCEYCYGDGLCRNEFHDLINSTNPFLGPNDVCPECGCPPASPGNCAPCGGTGELPDD